MVTPAALATNTVVELETVDPLSSNTSKTGDFFHLKVSAPVYLDGVVMIPAGTQVVGQVVHAAKSGMGGKAGELILAARYIDMPPKRVKLHAAFGSAGQSRSSASMVATVAIGVIGLAIHGKQVNLPAGTPISARLAERFTPESSSDASLNPQQSTNPGTTHE